MAATNTTTTPTAHATEKVGQSAPGAHPGDCKYNPGGCAGLSDGSSTGALPSIQIHNPKCDRHNSAYVPGDAGHPGDDRQFSLSPLSISGRQRYSGGEDAQMWLRYRPGEP